MNSTLLRDLPISVKVALAPVIVVLCLLGLAAQSLWNASATRESIAQLASVNMPKVAAAGAIRERVTALNAMVMQSLALEGAGEKPEKIEVVDKAVVAELKAVAALFEQAKSQFTDEQESARLDEAAKAYAKFMRLSTDTLDLKTGGLAAAASMMATASASHERLSKLMSELVEQQTKEGLEEAQQVQSSVTNARNSTLLVLALALALSAIATLLCTRLISRPLAQARDIASHLADGNLALAPVQDVSRDATGQVLVALQETADRFNQMIAHIRSSADEIDTASREISIGNTDLANRTEQSASALQQTASALVQLTHSVRQSADTAQQANQLAHEASAVAREGGAAFEGVVTTMQAISVHARRISEIIATIDGIAFQTNILALNAAVEAARAGEHGRGFAVVASEVRSLAGRSGEAAKEIRSLIGASVEQVDQGGQRVTAAGQTIQRIVDAIGQVSTLVQEMSTATVEQAHSIASVNTSIQDMDRSTQQNAALVEEAAAAAESLQQQSNKLVDAISVFRVKD